MDTVVKSLSNLLLHSGPGWLNDIFSLSLHLDADTETYAAIPHTVKDVLSVDGEPRQEHFRCVFASGAPVRGFLRVLAPPGRSVRHAGITAKLESSFYSLDDVSSRELYEEEVIVIGSDEVDGVVDYPFVFPGTGKTPLAESYEGDMFSIRHTLTLTVLRPWYTFEVSTSMPVEVQRVHVIEQPAVPSVPQLEGEDAPIDAQLALYGPQELVLDTLPGGGTVVANWEKGCFELGERLLGTIMFVGVPEATPVVLVKLAIVKIEYAGAWVGGWGAVCAPACVSPRPVLTPSTPHCRRGSQRLGRV